MSTLEATVSLMEKCTEDELNIIQQVIRQFLISREQSKISKEQFLDELEIARNQHITGEFEEAKTSLNNMKEKYGI